MSDEKRVLSSTEIDALGEVLNISMGSAATAISSILDKQVSITTPKVEVQKFHDVSYAALEPALLVKIEYVEGISGSNVMVFRQSDMQVILNLMMGVEDEPSDDFVFDEMSMSAACELMNQMMGASATALSNFLGKPVNISTPQAFPMDDEHTFEGSLGLQAEENIVSVSFDIDITNIMRSEFISVMTCQLAGELVDQIMPSEEEAVPIPAEPQPMEAAQSPAAPEPSMPQQPASAAGPSAQAYGMPPQNPQMSGQPPQMPQAQMPPQGGYPGYPGMMPGYPPEWQQAMQQGMMMPPPYWGYPPYGYPPAQEQNKPHSVIKSEVSVQTPKFPSFAGQGVPAGNGNTSNMDLMMNVPLNISVEIGRTRKKIREIMDFTQGTVIDLEKQAGAPVDIVVNGQLIARGDVVVVDDNFAVRVTEIVKTQELLDSLEKEIN